LDLYLGEPQYNQGMRHYQDPSYHNSED
jgi:hypothetical protein